MHRERLIKVDQVIGTQQKVVIEEIALLASKRELPLQLFHARWASDSKHLKPYQGVNKNLTFKPTLRVILLGTRWEVSVSPPIHL